MEKVPFEIKYIIMSYVYSCKKELNYICDKETLDIYKFLTKDCERIFIIRKNVCKRCEKEKVIKMRMILNNLLPG